MKAVNKYVALLNRHRVDFSLRPVRGQFILAYDYASMYQSSGDGQSLGLKIRRSGWKLRTRTAVSLQAFFSMKRMDRETKNNP